MSDDHGSPTSARTEGGSAFRSGFVAVVGRPNVGKSTLVNEMVGRKVSIVSDRPQTTRTQVRGVHTTSTEQVVFLDTPGLHKPRTLLGERANERALATLAAVDVVCFVIEANAPIGSGDRFVAARSAHSATPVVVVVNKVDLATREEIAEHLAVAANDLAPAAEAFVPVSGKRGDGLQALLGELVARLPRGPRYYPEGIHTDQADAFLAAELVREQLLAVTRDELPHSIAVTVDDVDERQTASGPLLAIHAVVRVERDSQKGIVIGRGGAVLKQVGTNARRELEALLGARVHLEIRVKVDPDWQRRAAALDRLGL